MHPEKRALGRQRSLAESGAKMRQSSSRKTTGFSIRWKLYTEIPRMREERIEEFRENSDLAGDGPSCIHHSPLTSSFASRSTCSNSCSHDKLIRSRDSPAGTLGGRIPGMKNPASRSAADA